MPGLNECPVKTCEKSISGEHLMCRDHWYMVPRSIRSKVWNSWRARQAAMSDHVAVQRHEDAKAHAISAVNQMVLP